MKLYKVQYTETSNVIQSNLTLAEAQECIRVYELIDTDNEEYIPNLYEIEQMKD